MDELTSKAKMHYQKEIDLSKVRIDGYGCVVGSSLIYIYIAKSTGDSITN